MDQTPQQYDIVEKTHRITTDDEGNTTAEETIMRRVFIVFAILLHIHIKSIKIPPIYTTVRSKSLNCRKLLGNGCDFVRFCSLVCDPNAMGW